jgi:2-polyprenyl-6-methoxyphenol hydroxylase-like FAD-dependent oxidoreductase
MTNARTALVIGGGIAGPAAAIALEKAGIESTVYESHPRGADGIGVFLTVASNGIDALRTIGADRLALAAGFPTPGITLRSTTGKNLGTTRTGLSLSDGTTSHTIKRGDLYTAIHDEAASRGIAIEYGRRLIDLEQSRDRVRAVFEDGSEATGGVLIGADGIHSVVRGLIDPQAPAPTYAGLVNLGGYTRGVDVDAEPGTYTMIFGKRAFFGYVLSPHGDVWWFANVPRGVEPARGEVEGVAPEDWRRTLAELFVDDTGPATELVQATHATDIMRASPVHFVPHLLHWHTGRVIVIGDAAHAPTPTSGQGASLAIEDGVVLAKCLRDLPDPRQAFARFEALRRPRVERIIKAAARINSSKAAGPIGRVFRDAVLPVLLKTIANGKRANEVYDYHIDWNAPVNAVAV